MKLAWSVLAILTLAIPSASAFAMEFEVDDGALAPEAEIRTGTLTATITCAEAWERTPPSIESELSIQIDLATDHDGLILSGPNLLPIDTSECTAPTEDEVTAEAKYTLQGRRDAPAFTPIGYTLNGELEAGELGENATANVEGSAQVGFYGAFSVEFDGPVQVVSSSQDATYTFTILNFGNGDGTAAISLLNEPPEGIDVLLPPETPVPADLDGADNSATLELIIGREADVEVLPLWDFQIQVDFASSADRTLTTEPVLQSLSLRIEDPKGAPAPTPLLAIPALVAAAMWARRRA